MPSQRISRMTDLRASLAHLCMGPQMLAFVPALCLTAFWLGGEMALIVVSLSVPFLVLLINPDALNAQHSLGRKTRGFVARSDFEEIVATTIPKTLEAGHQSAVFLLQADEYTQFVEQYGRAAAEQAMARVAERFESTLRQDDVLTQLGDHRFGFCISPAERLDIEACIQLAGRLQMNVEEPISIDGTSVYFSASIGFCLLSRSPAQTSQAWINAAETALIEARRRGPSTIRAFTNEMQRQSKARQSLRDDAQAALENGQIQPWYQPQISTDTGRVTGFEALARWVHPERGLIAPGEFLPVFEEAGLLERLGEVIMYHALTALKAWDSTGVNVPCVGVNFSGSELNDPRLVDRIKWELDRFDIAPERIAVEVLETVVSQAPEDMVARNVKALGDLGCRIDLDDFGTGNASISAIRRFNVTRIKIDRSFVMKADRDSEQQRMVAAILTMAERLGIETLAEGVETVGEHALLSQLGCGHVQGFGISRPIPFEQTVDWIREHESKLEAPLPLPGRKANDR